MLFPLSFIWDLDIWNFLFEFENLSFIDYLRVQVVEMKR